MPEQSDLDRRLRAVERALTDGDHDVETLRDAAAIADRLDDLEERIATLEERTAELDAATQAVRGYVGNVRAVNEDVEERADAALAAVDRIEARLEESGEPASQRGPSSGRSNGRTANEARAGNRGAVANEAALDEDYGIEMPPPGSADSRSKTDAEDRDDRSVIDRVREAL